MPSQQLDAFAVKDHVTLRAGDGAFLRIPAEAGGAGKLLLSLQHPDQAGKLLAERISAELRSRQESRFKAHAGRVRLGMLAPPILVRSITEAFGNHALAVDVPAITDLVEPRDGTPPFGLAVHFAETRADRTALDQLPGAGTAVVRCYREGGILLVDPLALTDSDASGSQVLRRRLAASSAAAELDAWLALGRPQPLEDISATALGLLSARLVAMVAAWHLDTASLPAIRRTLWRLDMSTLCVSEHPVLAFPEPAPLP